MNISKYEVSSIRLEIDQARAKYEGDRDWATWCPACLKAWPGHVEPSNHEHYLGNPLGAPMHTVTWLDFTGDFPDDGECHCCDVWRAFTGIQEHFGFGWWRDVNPPCKHEHHAGEMWFA